MSGELIAGRYRLVDPIGTGGTGTVWRAFDEKLDTFCAAKLLRQRDAGELLRFAREQSVRLQHPHVVSPYAWAADDGRVLIASELIDGGSLTTLLGDWGPLDDATITTVLLQLLSALQAVHDAQLIHRDVKPGNLLLRATGEGPLHVLLTDFGLTIGKRDARLTQVGTVIGTPGYLPPEVLAGGIVPDATHDLYAAGRLAVAMSLGGEPDLRGPLPDEFDDPVLRRAVAAMLRPDPDRRPADAAAAAELLADAPRATTPRTRDGEALTVLDQLPPLPDDWSPAASDPAAASPGPASSGPAGERPTLTLAAGAVTRPVTAEVVEIPTTVLPVVAAHTAVEPAQAWSPVVPGATVGSARRRSLWLVIAAVVLIVGGLAIGLTALLPGGGADPESPTTTDPTGTPPSAAVEIGSTCSWQQEGDQVSTDDGVAVCTQQNGAYSWQAVGG